MRKKAFIILSLFILISVPFISAQENNLKDETSAEVTQLNKFHEVIFPIWHKAYPKKDVAALKSYTSKVKELAELIYNAELPGILRDKKGRWDEGIEKFKNSVDKFIKNSEENNDNELLKSTEELHSNYENLVRIIHPVTEEIDEFHKVLYVIYHYYNPEENYDKIKSVADDFLEKAQKIKEAKLPKKFESKSEEYNTLSDELLSSVKELNEICSAGQNEKINSAVDKIHLKYQKLESLFD